MTTEISHSSDGTQSKTKSSHQNFEMILRIWKKLPVSVPFIFASSRSATMLSWSKKVGYKSIQWFLNKNLSFTVSLGNHIRSASNIIRRINVSAAFNQFCNAFSKPWVKKIIFFVPNGKNIFGYFSFRIPFAEQ